MEKIKKAFPSLSGDFYDILCERIKENNFSDKELINAINHVIDTCIYPVPTIANFILFKHEDSVERDLRLLRESRERDKKHGN